MISSRFDHVSTSIQARHLEVPLDKAFSVTRGELSHEVTPHLEARQFEFAPVLDEDGRLIGLFDTKAPSGRRVEEVMHDLTPDLIVSGDTSIADLMEHLSEHPFLFVLHGRTISGFVTQTDMGRPEARTYMYVFLSDLEIALAELLRESELDQAELLAHLNNSRRMRCEESIQRQRETDAFVDTVAALDWADLLTIAGRLSLREYFKEPRGGESRSFNKRCRGLNDLRNTVMHPVRTHTSIERTWDRLTNSRIIAEAAREILAESNPIGLQAL